MLSNVNKNCSKWKHNRLKCHKGYLNMLKNVKMNIKIEKIKGRKIAE